MDWSEIGIQRLRNAAILDAQLQDALNDVWEWKSISRSNEESLYLKEMEECLAFFAAVVQSRLSETEPNVKKEEWGAHVSQLLDSYESAKRIRGQALGYHLSSLVCDFVGWANGIQNEPEHCEASSVSNIGKNIQRLKRECGWTFDELADETFLDRKQIIMHAHGRSNPRPRNLRKYADVFSKKLGRRITPADLET